MTIMESTPNLLKAFDKGYMERRRIEDEKAYFDGRYVFEAVSIALANIFRKKGQKPYEYLKKPLMQEYAESKEENTQSLTEEEKRQKTELLFMNLQIQMANYNLSKGKA